MNSEISASQLRAETSRHLLSRLSGMADDLYGLGTAPPTPTETRQQIVQLQLRRLPPVQIASTISGASSVSRRCR